MSAVSCWKTYTIDAQDGSWYANKKTERRKEVNTITIDANALLTKKRWHILFASCLINLCIGSMYAWSSLSAPMAQALNANLSSVFSTANAVSFITMIIGGLLNDKFGPRWVMFAGGILFGVGMFASGFAQNVTHLILSYGLCVGWGMSLVYGCTISNTIKFFPDKRGMVGGMTTASYGISSVIFAPLADWICSFVGARATFMILGSIFLVIVCAGSFFMTKAPDGFMPLGFVPPLQAKSHAAIDKTPLQMLCTPVFYVMLIMLTCGGTFGLMIISGAKNLALGMTAASGATATLFVSVLCLFNTAGRLVAGTLSDKLGRIRTLRYALILALAGLAVLYICANTASISLFAVGVMLIGICFGTFMGVFPGFCTDQFGTKNNTVNYGIMWIGFSAAGIVGPSVLAAVHNASGSYQGAFVIAFVMAAVGLGLTVVYKKLSR